MNKYYSGIQWNNWVVIIKKGKGKLPLFCGNVERVISIYDVNGEAEILCRIYLQYIHQIQNCCEFTNMPT